MKKERERVEGRNTRCGKRAVCKEEEKSEERRRIRDGKNRKEGRGNENVAETEEAFADVKEPL